MSQWIAFSNKLLKLADVDFFEFTKSNRIECHYHQGMSYLVMEEHFENHDEAKNRYMEIAKITDCLRAD